MADALDAPLLTRLDDAAGYLTLNRPAKGNALDPALIEALGVAFSGCLADGARCIVFAGAGNNFCTGSDLSDLEALSDGDLLLRFVAIELLLQRVHAAPVVTIAIAHGRTLGAGADLFVACDRRIALTGSSFSFPGPGFGLVLGTARLAQRIGRDAARALLVAGRSIDADEALARGLATERCEKADLPVLLSSIGREAARRDPETVERLHRATSTDQRDTDLANLVRSASRPGLKHRIAAYRRGLGRGR